MSNFCNNNVSYRSDIVVVVNDNVPEYKVLLNKFNDSRGVASHLADGSDYSEYIDVVTRESVLGKKVIRIYNKPNKSILLRSCKNTCKEEPGYKYFPAEYETKDAHRFIGASRFDAGTDEIPDIVVLTDQGFVIFAGTYVSSACHSNYSIFQKAVKTLLVDLTDKI